ncbi:glycosyltransferase family 4 protein [Oerskovia sp. Sa1BUA8]|uniref:D-inositol 3-phosphate glycosyltransferase n=1 Tax=Oerskovia douganii TaxID=2762210 RepID=A0A9D5YXV2_9CELL|nr:glycosyltransferase family 4 protein [Oerskovia douganii]MBE7699550.1 glycosyltransferase family 4 protein [Oerskovia douganii]
MSARTPRVTVVSRIFAPEPAAASFRLSALVKALDDRGADVTVLTVRPHRGSSAASGRSTPGARVRRWPVLRDRTGYVRGYVQYMSFDLPLFFRLLLCRRPDVVVAEPPPTTGVVTRVVCAIRRVPYVYYAADVWSDAATSTGASGPVVSVLRRLEKWALSGARRVIAINDGVAGRVRALGARDVAVVRNGIDTGVFTDAGTPHQDAPTGPYAVYAGTTSEWQGADIFVRAMPRVQAAVPDANLVFLGQGSAWEALQEVAASLPDGGERVRFLPVAPPAVAAQWLRGARACLVSMRPEQGYDFAFPTKVFAGVASGTPVLFAGPGPVREALSQHALGVSTDYDVDEVADEMIELLRQEPTAGTRHRLASWAVQNASAESTGRAAADVVLAAVGRRTVPDGVVA